VSDFEVFRSAGGTRGTGGMKFGLELLYYYAKYAGAGTSPLAGGVGRKSAFLFFCLSVVLSQP